MEQSTPWRQRLTILKESFDNDVDMRDKPFIENTMSREKHSCRDSIKDMNYYTGMTDVSVFSWGHWAKH